MNLFPNRDKGGPDPRGPARPSFIKGEIKDYGSIYSDKKTGQKQRAREAQRDGAP